MTPATIPHPTLDRVAAPVKVCGPTLGLDVAAGENVVPAAPVLAGPLPPFSPPLPKPEPEPEPEPLSGVALALGIGIRPTSPPPLDGEDPEVGVAVMNVTCGTVM
jgi:hypothetical protein